MELLSFVKQNWNVIAQAPWVFVALVVLIGGSAYWLGRHFRNEESKNLRSRLELKDALIDDYKRKLDGASPQQAALKIAELEKRLDSPTPVPIEELQRDLKHAEAVSRQKQIRQLVDNYLETHSDPPPDSWINDELEKLGVSWRALNKGSHYETYEPARWS